MYAPCFNVYHILKQAISKETIRKLNEEHEVHIQKEVILLNFIFKICFVYLHDYVHLSAGHNRRDN